MRARTAVVAPHACEVAAFMSMALMREHRPHGAQPEHEQQEGEERRDSGARAAAPAEPFLDDPRQADRRVHRTASTNTR